MTAPLRLVPSLPAELRKGARGRLRFHAEVQGDEIAGEGAYVYEGERGKRFHRMHRFVPCDGGHVIYLYEHEIERWGRL